MSDAPLRCVVDASAAIKLFVEQEFSEKVQRLFAHLADESLQNLMCLICITSSAPISCSNTHADLNAPLKTRRLILQI